MEEVSTLKFTNAMESNNGSSQWPQWGPLAVGMGSQSISHLQLPACLSVFQQGVHVSNPSIFASHARRMGIAVAFSASSSL